MRSQSEIVGEFDAYKWADFWLEVLEEHPGIATDRDTMMGWFANAIMAGYDHHRNELREQGRRPKVLVHIKMGLVDMGDGQPPWIPGPVELENSRREWQKALGDDYLVVATHMGEKIDLHRLNEELWVPGD